MRLELLWSRVERVVAGSATRLDGHTLTVDLDDLRTRLAADPRLGEVRLDLAHPGDSCRIGRIFDVMAPRARLDGGENYPGVLGALGRVGSGRTRALRGV